MKNSAVISNSPGLITSRNIYFLLFNIVTMIIFYNDLQSLYSLPLSSQTYSYLLMIPVISGYFIFIERQLIFSNKEYSVTAGGVFIFAGIIIFKVGNRYQSLLNENDFLSVLTLSAILFWFGGFILIYGFQAFKNYKFPFLFLVFMLPIPSFIIDRLITFFQEYSAEAVNGIFTLLGIIFVREGTTFHFPTLSIEVAKECSGIRSSIALFITSIIAGHLFLKTKLNKVVLALAIIPITILKNAIRIVTLTVLALYVDMSFLTDSLLHKEGGIVFFIIALILLLPLLMFLRKSEKKRFRLKECRNDREN